MKIASIQMVSTPDLDRNLAAASQLLEQAAEQGARLAVLPEYFCLMSRADIQKLEIAEEFGSGPIQSFLAEQAKRLDLNIIGGTIPLKSDQADKVYNSCLVFDTSGQCLTRYDKVHLFRFKTDREAYDEGKVLLAGSQPAVTELEGLRVGLSVCYDLRFPEFYRSMLPLDLIVVPAAFTYTTGQAHWELLLRARAVENQCYVLGSGQGGLHENGRRTWGHSMIINAWGEIEQMQAEGEAVVIAGLDTDKMNLIRERLPALTHRVF